jgi:hypothetical protein
VLLLRLAQRDREQRRRPRDDDDAPAEPDATEQPRD